MVLTYYSKKHHQVRGVEKCAIVHCERPAEHYMLEEVICRRGGAGKPPIVKIAYPKCSKHKPIKHYVELTLDEYKTWQVLNA